MKKNLKKILLCFALILLSLLTSLAIPQSIVNANISLDYLSKYTNVLEDLESDSNFNAEDYPAISNNYSLQVINIAESSDNELFVYVYQPSEDTKNIVASTINISTTFGSNLRFYNYKLTLLNSNGVFYKYLVDNFVVSDDEIREYEITSIYRLFDEKLGDKNLQDVNGNTINEVDFKVSKRWSFNSNSLTVKEIETITISSKFVGYVRYGDGDWWHLWGESACDRHFVAFSTDKKIDDLMEADVYYESQSAHFRDFLSWMYVDSWSFGERTSNYAYLKGEQSGSYDNGHYNYTWNRIQTVNDFISTVNLTNTYTCFGFDIENESKITEENEKFLKQQQWVLSFLETSYEVSKTAEEHNSFSTRVGSVSILRLSFQTGGKYYNLGVIDNKQTGSDKPINDFNTNLKMADWFKIVIAILLLIVLLVVFAPFLPTIISFVLWLIKLVFKILLWIFFIPIKIINLIFKRKN